MNGQLLNYINHWQAQCRRVYTYSHDVPTYCPKCLETNVINVSMCRRCVDEDTDPKNLRAHGYDYSFACVNVHPPACSLIFHNMPARMPPCRDQLVCPRGDYRQCKAIHTQPDCRLLTNLGSVCEVCIASNRCSICPHDRSSTHVVTTDLPLRNQELHICDKHAVITCVTCKQERVEDWWRDRCTECTKATNAIVCCGKEHSPHSLTYPYKAITVPLCINCHASDITGKYWRLIQTPIMQQLYKTTAASSIRKQVSFAATLFMRLTWQRGDVMYLVNAGEQACWGYILSQCDNAASACVRVRWLPQPLRLMILGYAST